MQIISQMVACLPGLALLISAAELLLFFLVATAIVILLELSLGPDFKKGQKMANHKKESWKDKCVPNDVLFTYLLILLYLLKCLLSIFACKLFKEVTLLERPPALERGT